MKRVITFTLTLFISALSFAQVTEENRREYENLLEKNVKLFEAAVDRSENQEVLDRFERLKSQAPGEWLPLYYSALTRMYLKDQVDRNQEEYIDRAIKELEAARKLENNSEIMTLLARGYIHKVEYNNTAGPKYVPLIKSLLNEAVQADRTNPRAFLMWGNFYLNFPGFVGGDKTKAEQSFNKAKELYEAEHIRIKGLYSLPHWGQKWNESYLADIN